MTGFASVKISSRLPAARRCISQFPLTRRWRWPSVRDARLISTKQWPIIVRRSRHVLPPNSTKGRAMYFYSHLHAFFTASIIYVVAFLLACISWFNLSDSLRRSGAWLVVLAFVVHTAGLVFRMVLEKRPPVTNLYSSAIFIGWGAVVLGMILERFYRDGIGTVVASVVGFSHAYHRAQFGDWREFNQWWR